MSFIGGQRREGQLTKRSVRNPQRQHGHIPSGRPLQDNGGACGSLGDWRNPAGRYLSNLKVGARTILWELDHSCTRCGTSPRRAVWPDDRAGQATSSPGRQPRLFPGWRAGPAGEARPEPERTQLLGRGHDGRRIGYSSDDPSRVHSGHDQIPARAEEGAGGDRLGRGGRPITAMVRLRPSAIREPDRQRDHSMAARRPSCNCTCIKKRYDLRFPTGYNDS